MDINLNYKTTYLLTIYLSYLITQTFINTYSVIYCVAQTFLGHKHVCIMIMELQVTGQALKMIKLHNAFGFWSNTN